MTTLALPLHSAAIPLAISRSAAHKLALALVWLTVASSAVVFKSNLSLVGPRPHAVQGKLQSRLFDEAVDGYFARHRVKPGITGWAQINGWRGEVDTDEKIQKRVEFDLYYIENWSVLFDLYILLKTPLALMTKSENAY